MVVSIEALDCFDHLIWLRSGAGAADRLGLTQPTVSRSVRTVERLFEISAKKVGGEWTISGDLSLLNLQRLVHQEYRWSHGKTLRLEAQYYSGPLFCDHLRHGWQAGNFDFLEVHTPLEHLRTGVIDAWIGCHPDVPAADSADFACFELTRMPTHLVVAKGHPLVDLGNALTLDQVRQYPSLALPDNAFPKVQDILQKLGLWNRPVDLKRYKTDQWEGRVDQLTIGYATCFTIGLFDQPQVILPLDIPLEVGDTLIVRRHYAEHPRLLALLSDLRSKASELATRFDEVRLPRPSAAQAG